MWSRPTIESTIEVTESGTISDINIPFLKANYQPVKSLKISLISPMGTEVVLYDQTCGNTVNMSIGFDDEAPSEITCPPDDGIVFKPIDSLSAFIGEPTAGTWTLRVAVVDLGFGASGGLEEWRLEFCSEQQPQSPVLVSNDTLFVPPGLTNPISPNELLAEDPDNTSFELTYTVLKAPDHGILNAYNVPLAVGDQFTQRAIETFDLKYQHDGSETESDLVTFVIEDGTGGFFATAAVPIRIREGAVVDTDEPLPVSGEVVLFPVPAHDALQVQWSGPLTEATDLEVFDLQGRPLFRQSLDRGETQLTIPTNQWPSGLYVLRLLDSRGVRSRSFSVQR
jgi:subtilisin-like proprotein convertase family protein